MKVTIAPRARRELGTQLGYLVDRGAVARARWLENRLSHYLSTTVAAYPRTGTYLTHRDLWETWVPRTPFVLWYRFSAAELQVVRLWHGSQNRQVAPIDP